MWYLCNLFFIFRLLLVAINYITSLKQMHLFFAHFWEYLLLFLDDSVMKKVNNFQNTGCINVLENLEILEMSGNFFCPGIYYFQSFVLEMSWTFFLQQFTIFLVIISVRVPSTLKILENFLLSLILFDNFTLDFLCL